MRLKDSNHGHYGHSRYSKSYLIRETNVNQFDCGIDRHQSRLEKDANMRWDVISYFDRPRGPYDPIRSHSEYYKNGAF